MDFVERQRSNSCVVLALQNQGNRYHQCTAGNGINIVKGIFSCFWLFSVPAEACDRFEQIAFMLEMFRQCGITAGVIPVGTEL